MRAVIAIALVTAMGGAEIERAQQVARSRESERAQFHRRYVFDLKGDTVTQIEVVTEFRRLVLTTEEHLRLGDQLFSRGLREAEAAMAPTRGLVTFRSKLRFHPLNTYADVPPFKMALGPAASTAASAASSPLTPIDTQATGEASQPFKDGAGKRVVALLGATLQAAIPAVRVGPGSRPLGVVLEGREIDRVFVDFDRLD
jgi:hypothetical protein